MVQFFQNSICQKAWERFEGIQRADLQQILENEEFHRLPLPKDYDLLGGDASASSGSSPSPDSEGSLLKRYFSINDNLRGLERFGSFLDVFSNNANQNSAERFQEGILAQMAVANPFKRV